MNTLQPKFDPLSKEILDAAYTVHTEMGPGLLESIYEECLCMELTERGFTYVRQRPVYINYKGESTNLHFRLDLLIEDQIVVELKAVDVLIGIHQAQLLTYLKLTKKKVGLLINFNEVHLKNGIRRLENRSM
ncbi:MAG: GxxExxY protein [Flavobacteriales bacterium]